MTIIRISPVLYSGIESIIPAEKALVDDNTTVQTGEVCYSEK